MYRRTCKVLALLGVVARGVMEPVVMTRKMGSLILSYVSETTS